MKWEQWFCPNDGCATESWMVQLCPDMYQTWRVAGCFGGSTYTLAATDPVCPHCGATLCARVELGLLRHASNIIEAGPMLDYVRSLS
jgi:hypothetical protein